jgi:hypothetical protein
MLTGEFTLLEEPTEDSDVVAAVVLLADRPKYIGSERRRKPRDPMQRTLNSFPDRDLRRPELGWAGPREIWLPSIIELLCDEE